MCLPVNNENFGELSYITNYNDPNKICFHIGCPTSCSDGIEDLVLFYIFREIMYIILRGVKMLLKELWFAYMRKHI